MKTRTSLSMLGVAVGVGVLATAYIASDSSSDKLLKQPSGGLPYKGVNLAGAEFGVDAYGNGAVPGAFGVNYMYPDAAYAGGYTSPAYFIAKGMTVFRLPFRWERLQPKRNAAFNTAELARLTTTVSHLTQKGVKVILDPHNYARYGTDLIGSPAVPNADFANLWSRLATTFKNNPNVVFGLMNEPHDMPTEQWVSAANSAIIAIRKTKATNLILVPGNGWSGASSWTQNWYGTPNATAMLAIKDSGNNMAFEAHQYLDADGSGTNTACVSPTIGSERMQPFTDWLKANGKVGFLGEFGASSDPTCLQAIDGLLKHLEQNQGVYLGWTYWAGGPWWGVNWMMVEPTAGRDAAQMTTLVPHLGTTPAPVPTPVPTTTPCKAASFDAATMTHSTGGAMAGGWSIWSNGYIATTATFSAGQTTVTVKAGGSSAAGVSPHMVVSVGGVAIGNVSVSPTGWADYAFSSTAKAGSQEVRVAFDNDFLVGNEDRNLFVQTVSISCGTGGTSTSLPPPLPPPSSDTIRIMPLGDSITLGVNGGYRNGLWSRLTTAGKSIDFVGSQFDQYAKIADKDHEGHPGFTIGDIATNTDGWLTVAKPSYVLLMIGTNDVAWWSAQTASQIADTNAALIDKILVDLPQAWVVVSSIPPLTPGIIQPNNVDRAQLGKSYNTELAKRVQTRIAAGKKVRWADAYSVLTVADLYDGIHPTELAHDKMAKVWFDALTPVLP